MAVLPIEKGILKEFEYGVQQILSDKFIRKADLDLERDFCMRGFVAMLTQRITGETVDVIEVPSSWWQHLKQAHFPCWLLKYFPVDFKYYEARALYPKVSLPDEEHKVIFEEMPND